MMRTEPQGKLLELDDYEYHVLLQVLADRRNEMIEDDMDAEDLSDLLLKIIESPPAKVKKSMSVTFFIKRHSVPIVSVKRQRSIAVK